MINIFRYYKRKIQKETLETLVNSRLLKLRRALKFWYILNNKPLNLCPLCKKFLGKRNGNVDHIIPKSKGGTDNLDNLQFTHKGCNSKKGNKIIKEN